MQLPVRSRLPRLSSDAFRNRPPIHKVVYGSFVQYIAAFTPKLIAYVAEAGRVQW